MSSDFIKDMQQKMKIIQRIGQNYQGSADFELGVSYEDLQKRFKHMCDLYHHYATVRRYVFGEELNDTAPNWDVVVLYQVILSDYNEIRMLVELLKKERGIWNVGSTDDEKKDLVDKQLKKLMDISEDPFTEEWSNQTLPPLEGTEGTIAARRWVRDRDADKPHYPQKWSGELDGIGFDNR